jgi:hypothetical protein
VNSDVMLSLFMCCHLIGMASTIFNPLIYSYRNEHMRVEIGRMVATILHFFGGPPSSGNGTGPSLMTGAHHAGVAVALLEERGEEFDESPNDMRKRRERLISYIF